MSHHEGVSCDCCLKGNFRGRRYKCLVCFDYDLCASCYESGATSTRHSTEHPMQCILTRSDYDIFYGGEAVSIELPQSITCPFCGRMGFTEAALQEHVTSEHADSSAEVVCPICAAVPGGEPNHVTDDFATHLTLEHRSPRELISESYEPQTAIRGGGGRRAPHPTRGVSSSRTRRSQFSSSTGLSSLSPNSRESMDPIAELLSQLSGVRRAANLGQSHSSQLQQLQMQLQLERHAGASVRQPFDRTPIERVIRRHQHASQSGSAAGMGPGATSMGPPTSSSSTGGQNTSQQLPYVVLMEPNPSPAPVPSAHNPNSSSALNLKPSSSSSFLLSKCTDVNLSESEQQAMEIHRANRSLFVQELLVSTLTDLNIIDDSDGESSVEERLSHLTKSSSKDMSAEDSLSDKDPEVHQKITNEEKSAQPNDITSRKHDNDNNYVGSDPASENEELEDESSNSNRAMKANQSCDRDEARRMDTASNHVQSSNGTYELHLDQENQRSSHPSRRQPTQMQPQNRSFDQNKPRPNNVNSVANNRRQLHNGPSPPVGSSTQNQSATRYKVLRNRSSEASPPH